MDRGFSGGPVALEQFAPFPQMRVQIRLHRLRQHRHAILCALAVANRDLAPRKLDILHPQPDHLHQAHPGAIQQTPEQTIRSLHPRQHPPHLVACKHHRQTLRPFRPRHVVQPGQIDTQHLAIQKQQRRQRLILRRRRHLALDRKMRQKRLHLRRPQVPGMAFAVKKNETTGPLHILRFGANAVMLDTNPVA